MTRAHIGRCRSRRFAIVAAAFIAALSSLPRSVEGQTQTATTSIAVRVERHAGVLVSGDASAVVPVSLRSGSTPPPLAAVGNGSPELTVYREEGNSFRASSARARIAVTVFEP